MKPDSEDSSLSEKNVQAQWMEVTKKMGKILKAKLDSGELRNEPYITAMKVIMTKNKDKWYTAVPKVPPFLSTTNHPKNFNWDPNYDFLEIPGKAGAAPDKEIAQQGGGAPNTPPAAGGEQTNAFAGQVASSGSEDF
jgi:hypothetical protein